MHGSRPKCNKVKDIGAEYSKVGERIFTMKSEVVGWPSVVSDDFVQSVDQRIYEAQRLTLSELSCEFPQISRTVLYEVMGLSLGYHKFCVRCEIFSSESSNA
jgi:hypothetical protein